MNELQLRIGPYRTTFIGTEIQRASTLEEWRTYGEILRRVDEAKQWAIGDWLVDGKSHYGDGLYKEAAGILGIDEPQLRKIKSIAERFELLLRSNILTWNHHYEVASIKKTERPDRGKWKISDEPDHEKIQEILTKAEKNNWSVRELRDQVKQYKHQQQKEIELANEPEKFKVIYADPPWKYNDELIEGYGAATHHFPPMSISKLCALPVKNRAMENSVLFLWVTSPIVPEVFTVIEAWGFQYKSQFIWDKVKHNYGHYNSVRHELLFICTRGSCLPQTDKLIDSVQEIERTELHSEKPKEFRDIIDSLYPDGARIELFARGELPPHWKAWGDEII